MASGVDGKATQAHRLLSIATPLGKDRLLLAGFQGQEELSRLFCYRMELLSQDLGIKGRDLIGKNVTFQVRGGPSRCRYFNGFVSQFSAGGVVRKAGYRRYRAEIVPWTWFLTRTADCRIFQNKTVPQIVEQIFKDLGFSDFDFGGVRGQYPQRVYCVQYRETDFDFVSRLLEEEGIYYYFKHENGKHTLMLADNKESYPWCADKDVRYQHTRSFHWHEDRITEWERQQRFRTGKWAHTDYNFEIPRHSLMSNEATTMQVPKAKDYEIYDYPGRFDSSDQGRRLVRVRMEEVEAEHEVAVGAGTCRSFTPGGRFTLRDHPADSEDGETYVITSITHFGEEPAPYESGGPDLAGPDYHNRFEAIPQSALFRPTRSTPRPIVEGPQTAVVTGPPGEEIYTDEHGRVKVQFHWDREGKRDENTSCWIRVSQIHAGKGWGYMDIPRVGEEVIVNFLEGDPDQPIITGRVYNGDNKPPFALPAGKTRRGNTTKTYKGAGYNEMSMDDTPGKEQIRIHGQYNMDSVVNNNQTLIVGVDRSGKIGNNDTLKVGTNSTESVGNNKSVTVGNNMNVDVGKKLVIKAGTSITLKCGASRIYMNSGGVILITGTIITTAAAVNAAVAAPLTQIVGGLMLANYGSLNMTEGLVTAVEAVGLCSVSGGKTDVVASGENSIKGAVIKLN